MGAAEKRLLSMAGMKFDSWLGYDDNYKSNEETRHMYQATWNSMCWLPCGHLNLTSLLVLIAPEPTLYSKETTEFIYHVK